MVAITDINQGEHRTRAEAGEIIINDVSIPVDQVTTSYTSRFESKITLGDYSKDSDQLQSTLIQSNWAGGMLIDQHIEGATEQRGRWATAWTMSAEQLSLPPRHEVLEFGASIPDTQADARGAISMPLIEIDGMVYVAMGKELWKVTADTYSYTNVVYTKVADLPGYAVAPASMGADNTTYRIPLGEDGNVYYNSHTHATTPDTLITHDTARNLMAIEWWDGKQFGLAIDGQLHIYHPATDTWDPAVPEMKLPSDEEPRGLEIFFDRSGNQAMYLVSDRGLWAFDYEVKKIYPSTLRWPKHHSNGLGFTSWRDDALYISAGPAVTRYTRDGVRTDMGLDRDDGVPPDRVLPDWGARLGPSLPARHFIRPARSITDLASSQNFVVALLQMGGKTVDAAEDGCPYALAVWNESGWHVLVEEFLPYHDGTGAGRYPDGLLITETVAGYRVWWGEGAIENQGTTADSAYVGVPRLHSIAIPRGFHAPRQRVLDNTEAFASSGYYEMGWFDAGMTGFEKTWSHLELIIKNPGTGVSLHGSVKAWYRTDDNPQSWILLGEATQYGRNTMTFGNDSRGFPAGITSYAIDIKLEFATDEPDQSPIVSNFVLKFIKLALPGRAWQVASEVSTEQVKGIGPKEMALILARQTWQGGFSRLVEGDREYRVRVSQVQHFGYTGDDHRMAIGLNIIEVPIAGHPEWGGE